MILALHHVQLAMPRGGEAQAREFYGGLLGMQERTKPPHLAVRGGVWFSAGTAEVHLGVEEDFRPASKAHPALLVRRLEEIRARCIAASVSVDEDQPLEGFERFYVSDPFGNRLELMEPRSS
jgi:catechol 2,3-dioxygenase-like lactoylglutathione lyase family enzyme